MNLIKTPLKNHLEFGLRCFVFAMMFVYGSGKILGGQFYRHGNIPVEIGQRTLAETGSFDLAWTFFGYSTLYILFIGLSQLIGGLLLLFERTKLLGVAILLPILVNIIIVDYAFTISPGALTSAIVYLVSLVAIVFLNTEKVKSTFRVLISVNKEKRRISQKLIRLAIGGAVAVLFIILEVGFRHFLHLEK